MIQLKGFCREPLAGIRFDVANAAGTVTNEQGFVTQQYYDTTQHKFTTNWFQCFDIDLANGTNTITLHAVDLAGNTSSLQYSITLDLTIATLPPEVTLTYPLDGFEICGDSFTLQAVVNDPTATASVQIVSTTGATNFVQGFIERNGKLWAEGLPLNEGTNTVTLTVTSAANKSTTKTLTVLKSDVVMTMNPVPVTDLNKRTLTVTGTINVSDHTVWVNGVQATLTGTNWRAVNVPMNAGGTATFDIVALPPAPLAGRSSPSGEPPPISPSIAQSLTVQADLCTDSITLDCVPSRNGEFRLFLTGTAGKSFTLYASTNLLDWTPILTNRNSASTFEYVDRDPSKFPCRFFRVGLLH